MSLAVGASSLPSVDRDLFFLWQVMGVGAGAAFLKKKEQQEIISQLQELCAQDRG